MDTWHSRQKLGMVTCLCDLADGGGKTTDRQIIPRALWPASLEVGELWPQGETLFQKHEVERGIDEDTDVSL